MKRECGILLPVFCLPSRYGIGTFSKEAYEFIDRLKEAGQSYWQILPLGPTGYGNSPYQAYSAYAGSANYIDLETLCKENLLTEEECLEEDFGQNPENIDYDKVSAGRKNILHKAYERWKTRMCSLQKLSEETKDYCFYMALKDLFEGAPWYEWEKDIKLRKPEALKKYKEKLSDETGYYEFVQLKFLEGWLSLKAYANLNDIRIIGDIPIYVAYDSADCWAHPELFKLDKDKRPTEVAGCPPDGFSPTGQLWGNPLYNWQYHKKNNYSWWMSRMAYSFKLYDVIRIDHFRGFDEYYAVPAADKTAENGTWKKGPGYELFAELSKKFDDPDIIAEDLGFMTPSVIELLKKTGYPGMKVIEFAFDSGPDNAYLPHNHIENCVVYTGTHDNNTLRGWIETMPEYAREYAIKYMGSERTEWESLHWDFIRTALTSVASRVIIPLQDYMGLGSDARINEPSTVGKNWRWRMTSSGFTSDLAKRCCELAGRYGRVR